MSGYDFDVSELYDTPTCEFCRGRGYLTVEADGGGPAYACPDCKGGGE